MRLLQSQQKLLCCSSISCAVAWQSCIDSLMHPLCTASKERERQQPSPSMQLIGTVSTLCLHPSHRLPAEVSCCCLGMGKARHGSGAGGPGELRQSVKVGKLNLVDLAGSERVHITGATGWPNRHTSSATLPNHTLAMLTRHASLVLSHTTYTCAFEPGCLTSHTGSTPQTVSYKMKMKQSDTQTCLICSTYFPCTRRNKRGPVTVSQSGSVQWIRCMHVTVQARGWRRARRSTSP